MFKKIAVLILILTVTLTACAAAPQSVEVSRGGGVSDGFTGSVAPMEAQAPSNFGFDNDAITGNAVQPLAGERLVIKNVNLALVVKDPQSTVNNVTALAERLEGFVVTSNIYQTSTDAEGNKIMRASVSIRVPAAKLSEALTELKAMAVEVTSENTSGEDVTAQYTDLESHLRNLEAAEAQLQKIMDGATKTEDVLSVYNQLVAIRDQIEQTKGQMKYYAESAALSLITLDLIPDALSQPIEIGGWKPQGIAKEAIEALVEALQGLATAVIWVALYVLPLALLFGLPGFFALRWAWRKWGPKAKPTPAA